MLLQLSTDFFYSVEENAWIVLKSKIDVTDESFIESHFA